VNSVSNTSGIRARGNKLLVRPEQVEAVTKSGIIIPLQAQEKEDMAQMYGTAVEIGPMCWVDEVEPRCKAGDRIIFAKYAGELFVGNDGVRYRLLNARDVIATHEPIAKEKSHE
jgi:co-chaperonin GroES (HSP10)